VKYLKQVLNKSEFSILVGKRIRELREKKSITQLQLATEIEINESTFRNYENGRKLPSIYTVYKIACYLDLELNELVEGIQEGEY